MALVVGDISVVSHSKHTNDSKWIAVMDIDGDTSYPTGGTATAEALLRSALQADSAYAGALSNLRIRSLTNMHGLATWLRYDAINDKLYAQDSSGQVSNATDLSSNTYRVSVTWA